MKHHKLKINRVYFDRVISGEKTFEIRKNDRNYRAGDTVEMYCLEEPSLWVWARIGYVTSFNQQDDYVVFSLLDVTPSNAVHAL